MYKGAIDLFNEKIIELGYINSVNCLAEKITREGKTYPALCNGNEYTPIDLDPKGSLSYWRKDGEVSVTEENNVTQACNSQFKTSIPLVLIGFIKKGDSPYNDCYLADNIAAEIINAVTVYPAPLKELLKAKNAYLSVKKYDTDRKNVQKREYDKIEFEIRYTHIYFNIDFELVIISNQNCFNNLCNG